MQALMRRGNQRAILIIAAGVIAILLLVIGVLTYTYLNVQHDPQKTTQAATDKIIAEVGKLYELPNETPTIAQIQDKTKLGGQQFFDKAKNGDYVLIYAKNKLAIVYRESVNKLINVGPITTDGTTKVQAK